MGTKRAVEAFGKDTDKPRTDLKSAAAGGVPSYGTQTDATPSKSDEPKGGKKRRPVRAWGYLPRAGMGGLYMDHARGSKAARQFTNTGEVDACPGGVNSTGRVLKPVDPYFVDNCQGRSGQPDNQDTFRRKGTT